jgi:DNA-binding transcriptional ArsR family regulator
MPERPIDLDRLFHALGDPTRRAILDQLAVAPMSVSRLAEPLGVTVTAVAQHLQVLEECALVHTEKLGRVRTCRIEPAGFATLEKWIKDHRSQWALRLDRLGEMLAEEDESAETTANSKHEKG